MFLWNQTNKQFYLLIFKLQNELKSTLALSVYLSTCPHNALEPHLKPGMVPGLFNCTYMVFQQKSVIIDPVTYNF